jgi:hypothetical protein
MKAEDKRAETIADLKGRTRVTRQAVHVERIVHWLIRRFIDADAVLRFVSGKGRTLCDPTRCAKSSHSTFKNWRATKASCIFIRLPAYRMCWSIIFLAGRVAIP